MATGQAEWLAWGAASEQTDRFGKARPIYLVYVFLVDLAMQHATLCDMIISKRRARVFIELEHVSKPKPCPLEPKRHTAGPGKDFYVDCLFGVLDLCVPGHSCYRLAIVPM